MEEPGNGAGGVAPDDEQSLTSADVEERAERHREATLRLGPAPRGGHRAELCGQRRVDVAREHAFGRVARALESIDRLPDLADRPPLQRERGNLDHAFQRSDSLQGFSVSLHA